MDFKTFNQARFSTKDDVFVNSFEKIMNNKKSDSNFSSPEKQTNTENPNWSDYTVLIAEDEDTNYVYLQTALAKTKINVVRAKNGKEAVELVRTNPYIDAILMDIKMPEMNGLEATRSIKSFRKDIPVIAQTAFAMDEDRRNCEAIGCDDFLAKPIRYKVLIEALAKYLK
jgi:two-component system, cell cycle response regulator DivK